VTLWYDQTAEERERFALPRFLTRPPEPSYDEMTTREAGDAHYRWQHSWTVLADVGPNPVGDKLKQGWEVRPIQVGRSMGRVESFAKMEADAQARREQIAAWADGFIAGTATPGLIWPEDREAVLAVVAGRLREATADGFLLRALGAGR
jgi:hypothetical protein